MNLSDVMNFLRFSMIVLAICAVIAVPFIAYGVAVWNDFNTRWQNLWRILADIRSVRARRRGVAGTVNHHISHATRHEQQIASRGARRNKGRGSLANVSDIGNGWPVANAVNTVDRGLAVDVNLRDAENQAQIELNNAAAQYNTLLASFPRGWVGRRLGFRPWRLRTSSPRPQGRFRRRSGSRRSARWGRRQTRRKR